MKLITESDLARDPEAYIDMARRERVFITEQGRAVVQLVAIANENEISPDN